MVTCGVYVKLSNDGIAYKELFLVVILLLCWRCTQLYQPVNISVVLVGVEVWTSGDYINITTDSSATLDQFRYYRRVYINPYHRNDNAQLIT